MIGQDIQRSNHLIILSLPYSCTPEVLANFDVLYDEEQACSELNDKDYRKQKARGGIVPLISKNDLLLGKYKQALAWRWIKTIIYFSCFVVFWIQIKEISDKDTELY